MKLPKTPLIWHEKTLIGKSVVKKSGKPFKSGSKVNTVKGLVENPHTGLEAFSFKEDDSIVDIRQCELAS